MEKARQSRSQDINQRGSALWFILLAIALLAALAIAITRSAGTAEQNGSVEQARIESSALVRYSAGLEETIEQMRMRGVSENEISFANSFASGYANAACANTNCQLFDPGGGGQTYSAPPDGANDGSTWLFTGANKVIGIGDDANNELLAILPNITKTLCQQIDNDIGVATIPQLVGNVDIATKFVGSYTTGQTIDAPAGKATGCFQGKTDANGADISSHYYFYHTLIAR